MHNLNNDDRSGTMSIIALLSLLFVCCVVVGCGYRSHGMNRTPVFLLSISYKFKWRGPKVCKRAYADVTMRVTQISSLSKPG